MRTPPLIGWSHTLNDPCVRKVSQKANMFALTGGHDISCTSTNQMLLTMACDKRNIKVTYSNWGRTAPYDAVCPYPRVSSSTEDTGCIVSISDQLDRCDNLGWCQVDVAIPTNNPCFGTFKYAEVRYICQGEKCMSNKDNINIQCAGLLSNVHLKIPWGKPPA